MYDRRAEARKNEPLSHAWCAAGSQGKWVHHTSRHDPVTGHHHGCDTIGVGLGNDVLGPFPSAKLARKVADALNEAYALGQTTPKVTPHIQPKEPDGWPSDTPVNRG